MTPKNSQTVHRECPECESRDVRHVGHNPGLKIDGYQCRDCNHRWTEDV